MKGRGDRAPQQGRGPRPQPQPQADSHEDRAQDESRTGRASNRRAALKRAWPNLTGAQSRAWPLGRKGLDRGLGHEGSLAGSNPGRGRPLCERRGASCRRGSWWLVTRVQVAGAVEDTCVFRVAEGTVVMGVHAVIADLAAPVGAECIYEHFVRIGVSRG